MVQEETISQYMYQQNLPSMSEMTICLWLKGSEANADDSYANDSLLSIATGEPSRVR